MQRSRAKAPTKPIAKSPTVPLNPGSAARVLPPPMGRHRIADEPFRQSSPRPSAHGCLARTTPALLVCGGPSGSGNGDARGRVAAVAEGVLQQVLLVVVLGVVVRRPAGRLDLGGD